jgi:hypothetical protein
MQEPNVYVIVTTVLVTVTTVLATAITHALVIVIIKNILRGINDKV